VLLNIKPDDRRLVSIVCSNEKCQTNNKSENDKYFSDLNIHKYLKNINIENFNWIRDRPQKNINNEKLTMKMLR
jgi:hypothetical protein